MLHIVYTTVNKITNKKYIGAHSTIDINDGYLGSGTILKKAISKYGEHNFEVTDRMFFDTKEAAFDYERDIITEEIIASTEYYNLKRGGCGGKELGHFHSEELKKKISKMNTGAGNFMFGKKHTTKTKQLISEKSKGRVATAESKKKRSVRMQGSGNHMFGKTHSVCARRKISIANKGTRLGKDNSFYGRTHSTEMKALLSQKAKLREQFICVHCGKSMNKSNLVRWHNDNCKLIGNNT